MAEVLGVIASAITIGEVVGKAPSIILGLKKVFSEIKNAPTTIKDRLRQIEFESQLIDSMGHHALNYGGSPMSPILFDDTVIKQGIDYAKEALADLTVLVDEMQRGIDNERKICRLKSKIKIVFQNSQLKSYEKRLEKVLQMLSQAHQLYQRSGAAQAWILELSNRTYQRYDTTYARHLVCKTFFRVVSTDTIREKHIVATTGNRRLLKYKRFLAERSNRDTSEPNLCWP